MTVRFTSEAIEKHRGLADAIKSGLGVEGTVIKEKESHSAYNANLPDGITPDTIKAVSKYNGSFVKAAHVAIGETAAEIFKSDKSVDKVTASMGYFAPSDSLNFTAERSRVYPNPQAGADDPAKITKNLVLTMTDDIRGQSVKSLRDAMSAEFTNKFC